MNRIFRIVWNAALRQFVVASELVRSRRASSVGAPARPTHSMAWRRGMLFAALASVVPLSHAHTTSVGYVAPLGSSGTITFWYGTYHPLSGDAPGTYEGSFQITGDNGFSASADFSQIVGAGQIDTNRPVGLEDGVNNFYAVSNSGTELSATPGSDGPAKTWEGVTFSGLAPGTYIYSYVPAAAPTAFWSPYAPVLSNTLVVTAADLNGFPMLPGEIYTQNDPELNQAGSIVFNGGTYAPTADTSNSQLVTIRSGGGTVDTTAGDVTFTGGVDGTGGLTKTGDGTLVLDGPSSYTGGTVVDGGTLQGDSGSLQGDITNNAAVDFDQTTDGVYDGSMSGTGVLVKNGAGTLELTGSNTYSGGTVVNGGTLQGDTGSLQGDIINNAAVDFDQTTDGAYDGSMSGTGVLVKNGAGTLELTGSNTYNGGTVVNGGTLQGDTDSLQGDIVNAGTVDFDQTTDGVYDGSMSGTGVLVKNGAGTLELTGSNTYSGGTFVNDGTLQGDTGSLQGDIINNAAVDFDQTTDGAYAGSMSGTGVLVKNGAGTLELTGSNTYNGGTVVNGGTLQGDTGSLQGDIVNAGTVDFDQTTDGVYDGSMSGTGALVKDGAGTLELTGSNTYSGGTFVNDGTLQGDTGSLQGDITNNAAVDFDQTTDGAYDGSMSGTGVLVKDGAGTLELTGSNTYSGGTFVNGGTLQGDTGSLQGDIVNAGTVDFDQTTDGVYAGSMSGTGVLVKNGAGTLELTGSNTYSGGTFVNGGTLQGDTGSLQGDIVNAGTVDFDQTTDGAYAGSMSGTGVLVKNGAGTLELTGKNTYSGGTVRQRRHAAGRYRQPAGRHRQRRHGGFRPDHRRRLRRQHERHRRAGEGRRRHAGADRKQHLQRRHVRQRRHAAGRYGQPAGRHRQRRHGGFRPDHRRRLCRQHERHRRAGEGRRRHAGADRHQHLCRWHHRQRWLAAGQP